MSFRISISVFFSIIAIVLSKNTRIIGGEDTTIVDFPYMAAVIRLPDNKFECSGVIVTNKNILTSGHCVYNFSRRRSELKVIVGATNITDGSGYTYLLEKILRHPHFQRGVELNPESNLFDIAILQIQGVMVFDKHIKAARLASREIIDGDFAMVAGWGVTSYPSFVPSSTLKKTWMRIYSQDYCNNKALLRTNKLNKDQFCAINKRGVGPCLGDSGAPLMYGNVVIGIASTCIPCAIGIPDVYTSILYHLRFINKFIL